MKHYITTSLALLTIGTSPLLAQKADTLRRELRVLTNETIEFGEQMPINLNYEAPKIGLVKPIKLSPAQIKLPNMDARDLLAQGLPTLLPFYDRSGQRGFVSLAGGLRYNARVAAGGRIMDHEHAKLDVSLSGLLTDYQIDNEHLSRKGKEQELQAQVRYAGELNSGAKLGISGLLRHEKRNYHGTVEGLGASSLVRTESHTPGAKSLSLVGGHVEATLSDETSSGLTYNISPKLNYTSANGISSFDAESSNAELNIGITGGLSYALTNASKLGLSLGAETYINSKNGEIFVPAEDIRGYSNTSLLTLRPHWDYTLVSDNLTWQNSLGLTLSAYSESGESKGLISPHLKSHLALGNKFSLTLQAIGGARINSMSSMLRSIPYLQIGLAPKTTRTPIDASLRLAGLVTSNVELSAFARYAKFQDEVNYIATVASILGNHSEIAFAPRNTDGSLMTIGAGAKARLANVLTLQGEFRVNKWTDGMYLRPNFEVDFELTYRPMQELEFILGYELKHGMKNALSLDARTYTETGLNPLSTLRLIASYKLNKSWSFNFTAHALTSAESTMYYSYTPQRLSALIGATYKF